MAGDILVQASVEDSRAAMCARLAPLARTETIRLEDAANRTLAQAIAADRDQPPFAASAMDGYALAAIDEPTQLRIVGEAAAGRGLDRALGAGQAARIFTGAPLPKGADAVAIQEDVKRDGDILSAPATPRGQYVRAQGLDFKRGETLLAPGTYLDGVALSLAAAAGRVEFAVHARPRIAILGTGDEIVPPGAAAGPYQIYDSVSYGLAALVESWGAYVSRLHPRGDDVAIISAAAREALTDHDLLVTIGGASVGDHDLVKPALATLQLKLSVDKVNVRPGKPTWFGQTQFGPVLGLPGNPASALVCAHLFLRPLIARLLGAEDLPAVSKAVLAADLPANGPREHYLRAKLVTGDDARLRVTPFEQQDSSLLSIFRDANALIRLPPNAPAAQTGALVDVLSLGR